MLQVDELLQGALFADSHPTSLPGSEGWLNRILQSCKIGTTSRVEKASEQTLVGLNMTWNEKERKGQGKEEEMAGLGHRWRRLSL